jgi:hypothetical protein
MAKIRISWHGAQFTLSDRPRFIIVPPQLVVSAWFTHAYRLLLG